MLRLFEVGIELISPSWGGSAGASSGRQLENAQRDLVGGSEDGLYDRWWRATDAFPSPAYDVCPSPLSLSVRYMTSELIRGTRLAVGTSDLSVDGMADAFTIHPTSPLASLRGPCLLPPAARQPGKFRVAEPAARTSSLTRMTKTLTGRLSTGAVRSSHGARSGAILTVGHSTKGGRRSYPPSPAMAEPAHPY